MFKKDENKLYINPSELYRDSFVLAKLIEKSDFNPNFLIGIWRGASPIAISVHSYLETKCNLEIDHFPLRVSSYVGNKQSNVVIFYPSNLDYLLDYNTKLLIVDDVFDSGKTIEALINKFKPRVKEIKSATLFYKPKKNKTNPNIIPDFYVRTTNKWIVFPHDNFNRINF